MEEGYIQEHCQAAMSSALAMPSANEKLVGVASWGKLSDGLVPFVLGSLEDNFASASAETCLDGLKNGADDRRRLWTLLRLPSCLPGRLAPSV